MFFPGGGKQRIQFLVRDLRIDGIGDFKFAVSDHFHRAKLYRNFDELRKTLTCLRKDLRLDFLKPGFVRERFNFNKPGQFQFMKRIFLIFAFICLVQNVFSQNAPSMAETDRIRLAEAFRLADKLQDKVWPNWNRAPFAVLLVTPEHEFLARHPLPSKDFTEIGYDKLLKSKVYWRKRQFNQRFLATFPAVGGISTIVVGQAENTWVKTSTYWTVTLLHEHFHQLQDSQPNFYQDVLALDLANGDETGMWQLNYPFPYKDKKINEDFSALAAQLAKALETTDSKSFREEFEKYLTRRKNFNASLSEKDYRYLSFQFWKEGTARYTEYEIARRAAESYQPAKDFTKLKDYKTYREVADHWRQKTIESLKTIRLDALEREVVYPFGAAEAMLLDRAKIDWKARYFTEKFYLDKYFEKKEL
jgi:hypothetical protein